MKRILGIIFLSVGIVLLGGLYAPSVKKLRSYPTSTLEQEVNAMQIKLDAVSIAGIKQSPRQKREIQKEKFNFELELARRYYALEWVAMILGLFGFGMLLRTFFSKNKKGQRKKSKFRVTEVNPTELYVDEGEFYRRSQDAFPSKEVALAWYDHDPLRICTYCGSHAVKPIKGKVDQIQLITFYKKVPSTAKDLRIVLGSLWFVHPADELQCDSCEQRVLR